jgi:adenosylcobinamide-phosphate synthase
MLIFELQMMAAILFDICLGDPRFIPHPVCLIGHFCSVSERVWRKVTENEYLSGSLTVVTVLMATIGLTTLLLYLFAQYSVLLTQLAAIYLLYTCIAARGLVSHSRRVYLALQDNNSLEPARQAIAQIVGRDTASLDREGVVRACVETVAENMVDGITAPLFYAVFCSLLAIPMGMDPIVLALLGAMGYKAVNTMDSTFGYKNRRYIRFGMVAAKLDDVVNYLPARMSALILLLAAMVSGLDWRNAYRILRRDRLAHASPNAAHPESAVAGALRIRLGGKSFYFGEEMIKPTIGDALRPIENEDILKANNLILIASLIFFISLLGLRHTLLALLP